MNWLAIGGVAFIVIGTIMGYAATYNSDKQALRTQIELTQVKDYSVAAMMLIYGTDRMVDTGPGISITHHSDLYDRMNKVLIRKGDTAFVKNDMELLPGLDEVTAKYPKFPFGYYAKAMILWENKKPEWRVPALKAVDIFKITTTIEGHQPSHDEALKVLNNYLDQPIP